MIACVLWFLQFGKSFMTTVLRCLRVKEPFLLCPLTGIELCSSILIISNCSFLYNVKESDLHTKRTGHTEFVDKTLETVKPISLEAPKVAMEIDDSASGSGEAAEGTVPC